MKEVIRTRGTTGRMKQVILLCMLDHLNIDKEVTAGQLRLELEKDHPRISQTTIIDHLRDMAGNGRKEKKRSPSQWRGNAWVAHNGAEYDRTYQLTPSGLAEAKRLREEQEERNRVRELEQRARYREENAARRARSVAEMPERVASQGIEYLGVAAAGTSIQVSDENLGEYFPAGGCAPATDYFALTVRGNSMEDYGIHDGGIVIVKRKNDWSQIEPDDIVVFQVPEGIDIQDVQSVETLRQVKADGLIIELPEGVDPQSDEAEDYVRSVYGAEEYEPDIAHTTIKAMPVEYLNEIRGRASWEPRSITMQGNKGKIVRSHAFIVRGIVVEYHYKFSNH